MSNPEVATTRIRNKIGDDRPWRWELQETDGDALSAGQFTARAQVRNWPGGPVVHEWSTANGRATIETTGSGVNGDPTRWWVLLLVDDSRDWTWESGNFDLFLFDPDGHGQPIVPQGVWRNVPAFTDRPEA